MGISKAYVNGVSDYEKCKIEFIESFGRYNLINKSAEFIWNGIHSFVLDKFLECGLNPMSYDYNTGIFTMKTILGPYEYNDIILRKPIEEDIDSFLVKWICKFGDGYKAKYIEARKYKPENLEDYSYTHRNSILNHNTMISRNYQSSRFMNERKQELNLIDQYYIIRYIKVHFNGTISQHLGIAKGADYSYGDPRMFYLLSDEDNETIYQNQVYDCVSLTQEQFDVIDNFMKRNNVSFNNKKALNSCIHFLKNDKSYRRQIDLTDAITFTDGKDGITDTFCGDKNDFVYSIIQALNK